MTVTPTHDPVRRWAAAHAATVTATAPGTVHSPAAAPVTEGPREPVPAVLAAFTEVRTWNGRDGHINRVAWASHPDGRLLLATAGMSGVARIWDAEAGRELHTLTGHTDTIGKAEWGATRDGQLLLATGSYDGTARLWDLGTGECLHTLDGRRSADVTPRGVLVAWGTDPDSSLVLATGDPNGAIQIWDPGTGTELRAFPGEQPDPAPRSGIYGMTWGAGPNGEARLATSERLGGRLRIWHPHTGQPLYISPADRVGETLAISYGRRADGQLVLATGDDDTVRIWTEERGEFTPQSLPSVDGGDTGAIRWAPLAGGRLLLATSTGTAVHLWDGHTLRKLHTQELGSNSGSGRLDWTLTPDGHLLLAAAASGGRIHIWEAVLDPPVQPPAAEARQSTSPIRTAPPRPGPARLVLPPQEVTPQFPEAAQIREATNVLACATTPDGRTLLATANTEASDAHLWDLESGHHLRTLPGHANMRDFAWAQPADNQLLLATSSADGTARIWDPDTGQELRTLTGHSTYANAVAWGTRPDGTLLLATGSDDRTARIWDPDTGQELQTLTGHSGPVYAVTWGTRPDGTLLLATGSLDGTARIWDPDTGQELRTLTRNGRSVDSAAWATRPDGTLLLATSCTDGTARIWDPVTGRELRTFTTSEGGGAGPYAVAWGQTADGRMLLATAGFAEAARIWNPDTGEELASLSRTNSRWRSAAWTRDRDGNLLLLLANPDAGSGPARTWLVETGAGRQAQPSGPGRLGANGAVQASRQLLRLGAGGLWPPLGLLADLVTLTGPGDQVGGRSYGGNRVGQPTRTSEDAPTQTADDAAADPRKVTLPSSPLDTDLNDARLAVLDGEPGISRLRDLATSHPRWNRDSRAAFAALLAAHLDIPARYTPPDGTDMTTLASALTAVLAGAPEVSAAAWRAPIMALRAAAAGITAQVIMLLEILGPHACAADPLLPLHLAHHIPQLPVLSPDELRLLASTGSRQPTSAAATATDTVTYSPGTVGVARSGPLTRLLPTQLALPPDLRSSRLADNQLL